MHVYVLKFFKFSFFWNYSTIYRFGKTLRTSIGYQTRVWETKLYHVFLFLVALRRTFSSCPRSTKLFHDLCVVSNTKDHGNSFTYVTNLWHRDEELNIKLLWICVIFSSLQSPYIYVIVFVFYNSPVGLEDSTCHHFLFIDSCLAVQKEQISP